MGIVFSSFTTSLDGFIADANGQVGHLFDWYDYGERWEDHLRPQLRRLAPPSCRGPVPGPIELGEFGVYRR